MDISEVRRERPYLLFYQRSGPTPASRGVTPISQDGLPSETEMAQRQSPEGAGGELADMPDEDQQGVQALPRDDRPRRACVGNSNFHFDFNRDGASDAQLRRANAIPGNKSGQSLTLGDESQHSESQQSESENQSAHSLTCLLYTSPSPRDGLLSRMPSSA